MCLTSKICLPVHDVESFTPAPQRCSEEQKQIKGSETTLGAGRRGRLCAAALAGETWPGVLSSVQSRRQGTDPQLSYAQVGSVFTTEPLAFVAEACQALEEALGRESGGLASGPGWTPGSAYLGDFLSLGFSEFICKMGGRGVPLSPSPPTTLPCFLLLQHGAWSPLCCFALAVPSA